MKLLLASAEVGKERKLEPKKKRFNISEEASSEYLAYKGVDFRNEFFALDIEKKKVVKLNPLNKSIVYIFDGSDPPGLRNIGMSVRSDFEFSEFVVVANEKSNPFKIVDITQVKWKEDLSKTITTEKVEVKDYGDVKIKIISKHFEFKYDSLLLNLKRVAYIRNGYDNGIGSFELSIKRKNGKLIHKLEGGGDYQNVPQKIFIGKWLKDGSISIYTGSAGMGLSSCGLHFTIKDGKVRQIEIPCGSWGC